jgi:signal transduction histidine kinase
MIDPAYDPASASASYYLRAESLQRQPPAGPGRQISGNRILIVEDNATTRRSMELLLGTEFTVSSAESGEQALEMIRSGMQFDVVSVDLKLTGMSGTETLSAIKRLSPKTEVLLVTAYSDFSAAKSALAAGAYDYLLKPVERDQLTAALRRGLARRAKSDAADRTATELAAIKARLINTEKLSAVGEMLAGVMHELNNPLSAISVYTDHLLSSPPSHRRINRYLEKIRQSVDRCRHITQRVLDFSRRSEPHREWVQVNAAVKSALELKAADLRRDRIEIILKLAKELPKISADGDLLQHVLVNLITNAHHALRRQDQPRRIRILTTWSASHVRVAVEDNGPGVPAELQQKIFEPFFTTKKKGRGTGLGLSICYEIVTSHNGRFFLSSSPGHGACFIFELPRAGSRH